MLCRLCSKLVQQDLGELWTFPHHISYADLAASAAAGCNLCSHTMRAMLHQTYLRLCSTTIHHVRPVDSSRPAILEDAVAYHLAQDRQNSRQPEDLQLKFFALNMLIEVDSDDYSHELGTIGFVFARQQENERARGLLDISTLVNFQVPRESDASHRGRIITTELRGAPDIQMGKEWLAHCLEKHQECGNGSDMPLPTRLIAVGPSDGSRDPYLIVTKPRDTGSFASLSYRWGAAQPLELTKNSFKEFLERIPFTSLPRTINDAITVTRELGIAYVWIDSLCILQDCEEDWARECSRMATVYKNARINISCPAADDCNSGFLTRAPSSFPQFSTDLEWHEPGKQPIEVKLVEQFEPEYRLKPLPEHDAPLARRAWVLQERVLSPRTLFFGQTKMYFQCLQGESYENFCYPLMRQDGHHKEVPKIDFSLTRPRAYWEKLWSKVVSTYSGTEISFSEDRLPAFSAIAQEFAKVLENEFVAGLWKDDFLKGLLWFVPQSVSRHMPADEDEDNDEPYIAPSWSWASCRCRVEMLSGCDELVTSKPRAKLLGVYIKPKMADIYGAVLKGGYVELEAPVFRYHLGAGKSSTPGKAVWNAFLEKEGRYLKMGDYHPDDPALNELRIGTQRSDVYTEFEFLYLGHFEQGWFGSGVAMAVEKAGSGFYRRIGLLQMDWRWKMPAATTEVVKLV